MTGSRWSSAICDKPPNAPGVTHWSMGLFAAGIGLFTSLYIIADKAIPIDDMQESAEVEQVIVSLGAPAQRLEPPPPELIPDDPPEEPPPPEVKTERAEEAPPPEAPPEPRYFPPVTQATGKASSGFGEAKTPSPPPPKPVELSRRFIDVSTAEYIRRVKYPYNAMRRKIQGTGRIKVEINRNGDVVRWDLIQSTGSDILDREIARVAGEVDRLDPLPPEYPFPRAKLIIPFSFIMTD